MKSAIIEIDMMILHVMLKNFTDFASRCLTQPGGGKHSMIVWSQPDLVRRGHCVYDNSVRKLLKMK